MLDSVSSCLACVGPFVLAVSFPRYVQGLKGKRSLRRSPDQKYIRLVSADVKAFSKACISRVCFAG